MNNSFGLGTRHCPRKLGQKILRSRKYTVYYSGYHFTSPSHDKTSTSLLPKVCWRKSTVIEERNIYCGGEKGYLPFFNPWGERLFYLIPQLGQRLMGIRSQSTERNGEPVFALLVFPKLCALQELGVRWQACGPPCDILVNKDCIFSCPLLKWEYCKVCCGRLRTTEQTLHILLEQGIIKESTRNLAGKSEQCFLY